MNQLDLHQRYTQLQAEIHFHNHRYHVLDAPLISDYEYDQLLVELRQIEADLRALKAAGADGLSLSWDLWHMPLERLEIVREVWWQTQL